MSYLGRVPLPLSGRAEGPARTSALIKDGARAPVREISSAKSCEEATARAASEISTAVTLAPGISSAKVQAMHPLPVHRSNT